MAQQGANGLGYFGVQAMLEGAGAGLKRSASYMEHVSQKSLCQTVMANYQSRSAFTLSGELQLLAVPDQKIQSLQDPCGLGQILDIAAGQEILLGQ